MNMYFVRIVGGFVFLMLLSPVVVAEPETSQRPDWAVTGYVAKLTGDSFDEVLSGDASFSSNKLWVVACVKCIPEM